jgi:putative transposase
VWCPKYRYRILRGNIARFVEQKIRALCEWKRAEVMELSVQEDHVHLVVSIPPKVSISELLGILKGKTAIKLLKSYPGMREKPYWGNHFWSRGYCVSTIGLDEEKIRRYVKYQEQREKQAEKEQKEFGLF